MLTCYSQTESKGNFCLITVYSHKAKSRTQRISQKYKPSQTFAFVSIVYNPPLAKAVYTQRLKKKWTKS
jgi:hypothetical protein